jgi:hypothetical protein
MNRTVLGISLLFMGAILLSVAMIAQGMVANSEHRLRGGVDSFCASAGLLCTIHTVMGYGCLHFAFRNKTIKD